MKKTKSKGAAKTEIQVQGERVVLTGELGRDVLVWLERSNRKPDDLREVFGAYVGAHPKNLCTVEIELPKNLLEWATHEAVKGQGETLGQFITYILEAERYAETRMFSGEKWGGSK